MEKSFTETWIKELGGRWAASIGEPVPGSNGWFFRAEAGGKACILRILDSAYRPPEAVAAELHWMRHLVGEGIRLNKPVAGRDGSWVQQKEWEGSRYNACLTEEIPGDPLALDLEGMVGICQGWGRTMARMHRASARYRSRGFQRSRLDGALLIQLARETLPENDPAIQVMVKGWEYMARTGQEDHRYGMIHSDLTQGNLRHLEGELFVLDFDDCQYAPFSYDLAVTLYVSLYNLRQKPGFEKAAAVFMENLVGGYQAIRQFDLKDMRNIQALLDFFNAVVYLSLVLKERAGSHQAQLEFAARGIREGCFPELRLDERLPSIVRATSYSSPE